MADASSRGPEVPAHEDLFRAITVAEWWDPQSRHLSSGIFGFPKFSASIASMTTVGGVEINDLGSRIGVREGYIMANDQKKQFLFNASPEQIQLLYEKFKGEFSLEDLKAFQKPSHSLR